MPPEPARTAGRRGRRPRCLRGGPPVAVHRAHRAVLLIVDRYGQIYHVAGGARAEELPPVAEIEEWATFLATQCPECGVIDEPGYGEWSLG